MRRAILAMCVLAVAAYSRPAAAFCGFYVNGAGGAMYNDATEVVLMRMGTRTVLAMQNSYQGPLSDFAMVVPVPVVLQKEDVKTLSKDVFAKVDTMGAPRLVEYWEQDPCAPPVEYDRMGAVHHGSGTGQGYGMGAGRDHGVTIEAQFVVGEYQILVLSATDSTGLEEWLTENQYKIPDNAEPLLRPYVEQGSKFFVAKVDPKKVTFDADGHAQLSPLRFDYDSDEFTLPIRLGLAASPGKQDLIVNILSPEGRFDVANYKNVTIPTNLDVKDEVRNRFGEFYAALFDRTLEKNPGAVVTEYSWDASTCDPCPGPTLTQEDFQTLGADVLDKGKSYQGYQMVLTRLHARYGADQVPNDLVFEKAAPIIGGREGDNGIEGVNNFQGRYAIRHAWTAPIACTDPVRNRWGGPPGGVTPAPTAATDLAHAPRGQVQLAQLVADDVPEIGVKAAGAGPAPITDSRPPAPPGAHEPVPGPTKYGEGCCSTSGGSGGVVLAMFLLMTFRRRGK